MLLVALFCLGLPVIQARLRLGDHLPGFAEQLKAGFPRPSGLALGFAILLLLVIVAGLILSTDPDVFPAFLGMLVILGLALFFRAWAREFLFLMTLDDSRFPGRFDKAIWALVLIALPPVGLFLFRSYREVRWPEALASKPEPVRDLF